MRKEQLMLFHLPLIQLSSMLLPTVINTGAKIYFGAKALSRLNQSSAVDENAVFTPAELDRFQRSTDVRELRALHAVALSRGRRNEGDEHCPDCGHVRSSLLFHCFNAQALLTKEQWNEMDETDDATKYRYLVALGRRNAADYRVVYKDQLVGFKTCRTCGASTSAKSRENAG